MCKVRILKTFSLDVINYAEFANINMLVCMLCDCMLKKCNDIDNRKDFTFVMHRLCTVTQQFTSARRLLWFPILESGSSCPHSSRFSLPSRAPMQLGRFGCCLLCGSQLPIFVELYGAVALTHPWPAIFSESLNIRQLLPASARPTLLLQMSLAATPVRDEFQLGPMCLGNKQHAEFNIARVVQASLLGSRGVYVSCLIHKPWLNVALSAKHCYSQELYAVSWQWCVMKVIL